MKYHKYNQICYLNMNIQEDNRYYQKTNKDNDFNDYNEFNNANDFNKYTN